MRKLQVFKINLQNFQWSFFNRVFDRILNKIFFRSTFSMKVPFSLILPLRLSSLSKNYISSPPLPIFFLLYVSYDPYPGLYLLLKWFVFMFYSPWFPVISWRAGSIPDSIHSTPWCLTDTWHIVCLHKSSFHDTWNIAWNIKSSQ